MTPAEAREALARALTEREALWAKQEADRKALQAEYNAEVVKEAKRLFPRRKKLDDPSHARRELPEDLHAAILGSFKPRADALLDAQQKERDEIAGRMDALARDAEIRKAESKLVMDTTWSSTYNSQGHGSIRYAQMAAEMRADVARLHGIEVEVVKTNSRIVRSGYPFDDSSEICDFEVRVGVAEQVDVEILRRRRGLTLREQVRLCWKRGVNPRVYDPFLPVGYEEKVGLDYFGNDLRRPIDDKQPA